MADDARKATSLPSYAGEGAVGWPWSDPSPVWLTMMKNAAHPWYRPRGYAHFDRPFSQVEAELLATSPQLVAQHSFYPFLRYVVETKKVERDRKTRRVAYKDPKKRQISYAAHSDAQIYSYYACLLSKPYEDRLCVADLGASVIAFR